MKILVPVIKSPLNPLFDELSRLSSLNLSLQGIFSTLQINIVVIFLILQFCKLFFQLLTPEVAIAFQHSHALG